MMKKAVFALSTIVLVSCATMGGDLFPSDEKHEAAARNAVAQRTKFDMDCTETETTRISDVTRLGQQMTSMSFGVQGCEKKATYYVECVSNMGDIDTPAGVMLVNTISSMLTPE